MTRAELIAAMESAGAEQQEDAIEAALWFAHEHGWISAAAGEQAVKMLNAKAYESAALVLVPEGADWLVRSGMADHPTDTRPYAHVMRGNVNLDRSRSLGEAHAATPALALAAAALKAQGGRE